MDAQTAAGRERIARDEAAASAGRARLRREAREARARTEALPALDVEAVWDPRVADAIRAVCAKRGIGAEAANEVVRAIFAAAAMSPRPVSCPCCGL